MQRLRTRRLARMRMGVLLRCAGWNLKRAVAALRQRSRKAGVDLPAALKTALDSDAYHMSAFFCVHAIPCLRRPAT